MPDPELQWIPDETAQAIPIRTRVISVIVFAAIFLAIGVVIGSLTSSIPAEKTFGQSEAVNASSTKKRGEHGVETPSLALKSENETTTQKPATSASSQGQPKTDPPSVILLNPGTATKTPNAALEETRATARPAREGGLRGALQDDRARQATDGRGDMPPARDYKSLREYMLSR
jgi:flagellum-specific peptidoglycan hydrolase FlgJ